MENLPATTPIVPISAASIPSPAALLPLANLAAALSDAMRWRILMALAEGEPLMVNELATRLGASSSLISKHLGRMRKMGVVEQVRGRLYRIPPAYLPKRGLVDFGHCQIPTAV